MLSILEYNSRRRAVGYLEQYLIFCLLKGASETVRFLYLKERGEMLERV